MNTYLSGRARMLLLGASMISIGASGPAQALSEYAECSDYALAASRTPPASTAFTRGDNWAVVNWATVVTVGTAAAGVAAPSGVAIVGGTLRPTHNVRSYQYYLDRCLQGR